MIKRNANLFSLFAWRPTGVIVLSDTGRQLEWSDESFTNQPATVSYPVTISATLPFLSGTCKVVTAPPKVITCATSPLLFFKVNLQVQTNRSTAAFLGTPGQMQSGEELRTLRGSITVFGSDMLTHAQFHTGG